ncbi:MAG: hypothetical protein Q9169_003641 [Polycauliona sp. 2 TL-2023]
MPAAGNPSIPQSGVGSLQQDSPSNATQCRCFPGDPCWPKPPEWTALNQTLGGKLVSSKPLASPCHDSDFGPFDAQQCTNIQSTWFFPETHFETSSSIMAPYFTNDSCNPFLPRNAPCRLGNYISYAVNASGAADFQKTVQFAQRHNIRLTVRNTGHDYNGKATGAGAIGIWTHHMKAMAVSDYKSAAYTGKAMKMGAGVQAVEAYQYAYDRGLAVVGGNCPTVGIAGGYTQGGGHSPLSSKFGMAADQALEWEVVTASGQYLVASPSQNADLFWALSGGGGGTYAVVASLTVKAHPEMMTSAANLTFTSGERGPDSFWNAVRVFHEDIPTIVDAGAYAAFLLSGESFVLMPVQAPGMPKAQLQRLLNRTLRTLEEEGIEYDFNIGEFPTFYESYQSFDPPWNVSQYQIGGRLIPRTLVKNNLVGLIEAERQILESSPGLLISGVCVNVSVANPAINSVNPYWRTALFDAVIGTSNVAYADMMTHQLLPKLEKLTPGGGAYINEADFQQPDFQRVFYGANYPILQAIKKKYDPFDMFYAITAVGSEIWYEDWNRGGRLCRTAQ